MGVHFRIWIFVVITAYAYAQTTDDDFYESSTEGISTAFDQETTAKTVEVQTRESGLHAENRQTTSEKKLESKWAYLISSIANSTAGNRFKCKTLFDRYTYAEQCVGRLTISAATGDLMTPGYPNHYPNNVTCMWTIQAAKDRHIYLYFHHFHLEEGLVLPAFHSYVAPDCRFDMLYIAEEIDVTTPQVHQPIPKSITKESRSIKRTMWGIFCGSQAPPSRMTATPGSRLILVFHADTSRTETGFWASYQTIKAARPEKKQVKAERKAAPTSQKVSIFDRSFWEGNQEDARKAYAAIILFIFSICLVLMVMHCWQGSRLCQPNCRRRARVSDSVPSILMNMFGRTDQGDGEQRASPIPSPPPEYGEIVKTEEDWQRALERIGETEESMERHRSRPDNIRVEYDIASNDPNRDDCLNPPSAATSNSSGTFSDPTHEPRSTEESTRGETSSVPTSNTPSPTSEAFPVPVYNAGDGVADDYFDEEEMLRHLPRIITVNYGVDEFGHRARSDTHVRWN